MQDNGSPVMLSLQHIPVKRAKLYHYRIDSDHSNAYEVWKKMGSPQQPTEQQYQELEKAGQLALLSVPKEVTMKNGTLTVDMQLPRQSVSLVRLVF